MAPNRTTLECFLLVVSLLCLGVFHSVFCMLCCCLWQVRFGWDQGALEISLSTHVSRPLGWRVFVLRFSLDSRFNFQNFALILKHFCTRASVSFVCVFFLFLFLRVDRTKRTAWFGVYLADTFRQSAILQFVVLCVGFALWGSSACAADASS